VPPRPVTISPCPGVTEKDILPTMQSPRGVTMSDSFITILISSPEGPVVANGSSASTATALASICSCAQFHTLSEL
jgi:hypothetical protein